MSERLRLFLSKIAVSPAEHGKYLDNKDAYLAQEGLTEDEIAVLKSGNQQKVYERLTGQSAEPPAAHSPAQANTYAAQQGGNPAQATQQQPNSIYLVIPLGAAAGASQPQNTGLTQSGATTPQFWTLQLPTPAPQPPQNPAPQQPQPQQ